jgi:hypothetical protein
MSDSPTLDKLVEVSPRFVRSISLVRDADRTDALQGYILTPTGRDVLRRLSDALRGESPTRAWSITGPYGSGKSAFALFTAQLLSGEEEVRHPARKILGSGDADLSERFFGASGPLPRRSGRLCPVLVTGSRRPLEKALAATLASSLRAIAQRGRPPQIVDRLERIAEQTSASGVAIVGLFEEAVDYLQRFGHAASGILLIVDELGKFLEYGAANPDQGDVFVLQELAEAATRSKRPFLFITILHQAIDRYAQHMSGGRRAEWAKVQGRFEDVAFEERTEQQLRLLAHAIRHSGDQACLKPLRRQAKTLAKQADALDIRIGSMAASERQDCLASCYPLHPLTALILGPLFRQLAQNERSLFAFLASSEPFGFQEFLRDHTLNDGAYRLDHMYDYLMASIGPTLFAQARGKIWADVQSALERLHDATELEIQIAKSIGLLQGIGTSTGIPASISTLQLAMKGCATEVEVDRAVQSLTQRSVVILRRHSGGYALWEGSDVDIDDRLKAGRQAVEHDQNLAIFLARQAPPQPLIARRHYFQTGTLRYFETVYVDLRGLKSDLFRGALSDDLGDADGRVVYCLPRDPEDREAIRGIVEKPADLPVIAALPQDVFDLRELCHELVCLRWVTEHTPELETDRTARRELRARCFVAEQNLRTHLEWVFSPANPSCAWYYQGEAITLASQQELNDLLSRVCEGVYGSTPRWRNELINRRSLSSAAAAARRNLIEAMFEHAGTEGLGFAGYPPERSMYETLLRSSRLHRKQGGVYGFHPPDAKAEAAVREMWTAIESFLVQTEAGRLSVGNLFGLLRHPPFGLKDGVLPVILAAILVHGHAEVALYEEASFVPHPNAAVFERIFRSPEKFELQRFRIAGPRAEVFQHYAAMLTRADDGKPNLLGVVRPLVRMVRDLPDYVSKTRQIGDTAQRVLKALKEARQPDRLLFADLPAACGLQPFEASGRVASEKVGSYFTQLRSAFIELQRTYPNLLADIERLILEAFGEESPLASARRKIEHQVRLVLNLAVELKLKAFLMRAADGAVEDTTWLESIATLLAGKPPTHWDDQDRAKFEVQLAASARTFEHFRVLAFEMERSGTALLDGDPRMLRISVTVPDATELERVVQLPAQLQERAARARKQLLQVLQNEGLLDKKETGVAVLGELVRQLLTDSEIPLP